MGIVTQDFKWCWCRQTPIKYPNQDKSCGDDNTLCIANNYVGTLLCLYSATTNLLIEFWIHILSWFDEMCQHKVSLKKIKHYCDYLFFFFFTLSLRILTSVLKSNLIFHAFQVYVRLPVWYSHMKISYCWLCSQ